MTRIVEESPEVLAEYGRIPISFEVESIFDVQMISEGLGGIALVEKRVETPWLKDYDADSGEGPETAKRSFRRHFTGSAAPATVQSQTGEPVSFSSYWPRTREF